MNLFINYKFISYNFLIVHIISLVLLFGTIYREVKKP